MYIYRAELIRVIDGDTVDLAVDLGFRVVMRDRFRLYGINAWETKGEERDKGLLAKARLEELITGPLTVHTIKDTRGKYGRWLAILYSGDLNINGTLVSEGHARKADY